MDAIAAAPHTAILAVLTATVGVVVWAVALIRTRMR